MTSRLTTEQKINKISMLVNKIGKKSIVPFVFDSLSAVKHGKRYVYVKDTQTNNTAEVRLSYLLKGKTKNPFNQKTRNESEESIKNTVNLLGSKSNPFFKFVKLGSKDKRNNRKIIVQNIKTKESKETYLISIKKGSNPFRSGSHKFRGENLKKYVNDLGFKSSPQYKFVKIINKKTSNYRRIFIIEEIESGKRKQFDTDLLNIYQKSNKHLFDNTVDLAEIYEAQPKYEKLFKRLKIKYYKNFRLGKKIIDFAFYHPKSKKMYGLEVKHDLKRAYSKRQISEYKKISKLKQYSFSGIILSSPQGKYGISIKELYKLLISGDFSGV